MKKVFLTLSVFIVFFLSACSKFDDLDKQLSDSLTISSVAVFNAVPNSHRIEVSLDGVKLNASNERLGYGRSLPFRNWSAGRKKITIVNYYKGGKDTYEDYIDLEGGQVYSLFVHKDGKLGVTRSNDDMIMPKSGFAKVRVAHMSNDAAPFILRDGNGKQLYPSEIKYKDVTGFITVAIADLSLSVNATTTGKTPQLDYQFKPKNQGIYTFLIRGHVDSDDEADAFSAQMIEH